MGKPFRENVVVITGASRGIGRELALQLAERGGLLVLGARDEALLHDVADRCRTAGGEAVAVAVDVTSESDCGRLIESAIEAYGRLDTLINNAGISMLARFEELDDVSALERVMQVNYFGSVYCTHHALRHLVTSGGRLVAVASLTGLTGVPTRSGYAASKHAMAGLFDSLRIELRDRGVSVTVAYPGFVDTGIRERAVGSGHGWGKGRTAGRVMSAHECARIILDAAWRRRRQVVMTAKGKLGRWMKLATPALVDRIAAHSVGAD
jgi:short-subunit dehydrogenase